MTRRPPVPGAPKPGLRPRMQDTQSRQWLADEAVRRWAMRTRVIIENVHESDADLAAWLMEAGRGWTWNGDKTHWQVIQEEFRQLSWLSDDGWRAVRVGSHP